LIHQLNDHFEIIFCFIFYLADKDHFVSLV
jgi:hypothetical protein